MQHAAAVGGGEPAREAEPDLDEPRRRHRLWQLGERAAVDELGDEIGAAPHLADAMDGDDVGVREPRDGARLDEELLAQRRIGRRAGDELHRDLAIEQRVVRQKHLTHRRRGRAASSRRYSSISDGGDQSSAARLMDRVARAARCRTA